MARNLPAEFAFIRDVDPRDEQTFAGVLDQLNALLREKRKSRRRGDKIDRTGRQEGHAFVGQKVHGWLDDFIGRGVVPPPLLSETVALLLGVREIPGYVPSNTHTWVIAVSFFALTPTRWFPGLWDKNPSEESLRLRWVAKQMSEAGVPVDHSVLRGYLKRPEFRSKVNELRKMLPPNTRPHDGLGFFSHFRSIADVVPHFRPANRQNPRQQVQNTRAIRKQPR